MRYNVYVVLKTTHKIKKFLGVSNQIALVIKTGYELLGKKRVRVYIFEEGLLDGDRD